MSWGGGWACLLTGLELAYLVGSGCVLLAARVSWVSRVSREAIRCMARGCRGRVLSSVGSDCKARRSTGYSSLGKTTGLHYAGRQEEGTKHNSARSFNLAKEEQEGNSPGQRHLCKVRP